MRQEPIRAASHSEAEWKARLRGAAECLLALLDAQPREAPLARPAAMPLDAAALYRLRLRRHRIFGEGLFQDANWDMLLDLYAQRQRGRRVSVSSSCLASNVPPTTALRHIAILVERGLVVKVPDERDRRRFYVEMTPVAIAAMERFLAGG